MSIIVMFSIVVISVLSSNELDPNEYVCRKFTCEICNDLSALLFKPPSTILLFSDANDENIVIEMNSRKLKPRATYSYTNALIELSNWTDIDLRDWGGVELYQENEIYLLIEEGYILQLLDFTKTDSLEQIIANSNLYALPKPIGREDFESVTIIDDLLMVAGGQNNIYFFDSPHRYDNKKRRTANFNSDPKWNTITELPLLYILDLEDQIESFESIQFVNEKLFVIRETTSQLLIYDLPQPRKIGKQITADIFRSPQYVFDFHSTPDSIYVTTSKYLNVDYEIYVSFDELKGDYHVGVYMFQNAGIMVKCDGLKEISHVMYPLVAYLMICVVIVCALGGVLLFWHVYGKSRNGKSEKNVDTVKRI